MVKQYYESHKWNYPPDLVHIRQVRKYESPIAILQQEVSVSV
jgi:hypothetical protein